MTERQVSHYRVGAALGGGAMGRVFKAEDTLLGRTVALKFLPDELAAEPRAVERFLQEARLMASLEHRHICTVHEIGQDEDDTWFIAMAWCNGATLKQRLAHGPLAPETALDYARQTALGLACAHDHDIVHRDVKPANLIVTGDGEVRVLDFGIARLLGTERRTQEGALVGTFGYLSPEQVRGEDATAAADIWALGVVLYEMITGRLPFSGTNHAAQLDAIAHDDPDTLPLDKGVLTAEAARIIGRCLRKDPTDRYGSSHELASDLAVAVGTRHAGRPVPQTTQDATPPPPRRRRWPAVGAIALLLAALAWIASGGGEKFGCGASPDDRGVAVLPFTFVGDVENGAHLAQGLTWCVTDRLTVYEGSSDAFWMVPPGAVNRYEVRFNDGARRKLGARRVVSGSGRMAGGTIDLRLAVFDTRTGDRHENEFHDATANLRTWQQDIAAWVAGVLDPALAEADPLGPPRGCTTVPNAFLDYVGGVGALQLATEDSAGTFDAPIEYFTRAVGADSSFARARAELGYATWRRYHREDPARAAEGAAHVNAALRIEPDLIWGHHHLGEIQSDRGNPDGALAAFDRGLRGAPGHAALQERRAELLADAERSEEALEMYERSIAARPGYAAGYINLGFHHYLRHDYEKAERVFRRLVESAPGYARGFEYLGVTIYKDREDPEAERFFRRSLDLEPTARCYYYLGGLYYYQHRYEDAAVEYANALTLAPDWFKALHGLAESYRWCPGYEERARELYRQAAVMGEGKLTGQPDDTELLTKLASYYSFLGSVERAEELLANLAKLPPTEGQRAFTEAVAYEDLGRRDEALVHLERSLDTGGPRPFIHAYPGFRNLRTDARYKALIERYP